MEKQVQKRLIQFLRKQGCYVIKTRPGPGTPIGCPDVIALHEGAWFAFECKADEKSKFQPGQEATIKRLSEWGFAWVVHSNNIDEIISQLKRMF